MLCSSAESRSSAAFECMSWGWKTRGMTRKAEAYQSWIRWMPTPGPERPGGSPHPLIASQLPGPDSSLQLHRNGREGTDQQPGVWQGPDTRPPASLALGGRTYCCGPRRGQCPRSRPHSQCLRYLRCCPLGMCPERRRACPGLVLKALCCGQKGCSTQEEGESGKWHGGCLLLAPKV